jgi:threonine dehydratase
VPRLEIPTVSYADVEAASARLEGNVHRTPVVSSQTCDRRTGARALFKCENLQRTGSFKIRGAYNAVARLRELSPEDARRGVLAYSSGNHGQAIALAGSLLAVPTTVIMPRDAPQVKIDATRGYGAEVILYDRFSTSREELAAEIGPQRGLTLIPGFDHPDVIAGQGTVARELLLEVGELDLLLVCLGGGGLLSGCALAARALAPDCRVVGVEPELADDAARSFRSGTLHTVENPPTIADGARTPSLGHLTFPLVLDLVDDVVTVSERAIVAAMRFLWERMKLIVEPTGALAAAALLDGVADAEGKRVGVVLSGGNVDLDEACRLFEPQRQ